MNNLLNVDLDYINQMKPMKLNELKLDYQNLEFVDFHFGNKTENCVDFTNFTVFFLTNTGQIAYLTPVVFKNAIFKHEYI